MARRPRSAGVTLGGVLNMIAVVAILATLSFPLFEHVTAPQESHSASP